MTIRAQLYAAIVLTILGPLATTAVALHWMSEMGDNFDEAHERRLGPLEETTPLSPEDAVGPAPELA